MGRLPRSPDALSDRLKLLFVLAFNLRCRRGELLRLEWRQVDFGGRELRFTRSTTRNRTPRSLPFYGDTVAWKHGDMEALLRTLGKANQNAGARLIVEDDWNVTGAFSKTLADGLQSGRGTPACKVHQP